MGNKEDWEELERWNENRIQQEREKYKIDYNKINLKKENEKVEHLVKGLNITGKTFKIFAIIIFIIGTLSVLLMLYSNFHNIKEQTNVTVVGTIDNMYNVKIKVISQDIDEKGNGVYKFELKDNSEIKFTAIKKFGKLEEDFLDNSHKYYFNKWNSEYKKYFEVNTSITDEILDYDTHIEIEKYEDVEKSINIISEFAEFCGTKFYYSWDIYLEKDNKRIYPYFKSGMSKEETIEKAQEQYREYFN